MPETGLGLGQRADRVASGHGAVPEALQLRKDEPHPVRPLAPLAELAADLVLGLHEAVEIEWRRHRLSFHDSDTFAEGASGLGNASHRRRRALLSLPVDPCAGPAAPLARPPCAVAFSLRRRRQPSLPSCPSLHGGGRSALPPRPWMVPETSQDRQRSLTNPRHRRQAQNLNSSTLAGVTMMAGPRTTSPLAPTVYSPSRPALNFSPSLPAILHCASACAP